ncbi:hypothetical protein PTKIN_Ptkin02bG0061300 [Pterospermum kingtungense]
MKKIDEDTAKDLMSRNPKHWSRAFQSTTSKCDIVDNNMREAFNSILVNARQKSIITMLEEIRVFVMEKIVEKREFVNKWNNNYDPLIKDRFDEYKKEGVDWRVHWNGDKGCEVEKGRRQFTVNLNKKEYSCRVWQLTGIPCPHACCAIWHDEKDPNEFMHMWYHPATYYKAYQYALQPINGFHEWKKSNLEPIYPPGERKSRGRPKKARRKSKGEASKKLGHISLVGNINTCSICGQQGHNKRGCSGRASIPTAKVSLKETTTASVHTSNAKDNNQVESNVQRKKSMATSKDKGKEKIAETNNRPVRQRKPSLKGYGLYTNLKTG